MAAKKPIHSVGRRKTSTARVYMYPKSGEQGQLQINGKEFEDYFPQPMTQLIVKMPLELLEATDSYDIKVRVAGGGVSGQAGAVRHGISRALEKADPEKRPELKKAGFLTRDARAVERKKPGLHKARRATQFSKR